MGDANTPAVLLAWGAGSSGQLGIDATGCAAPLQVPLPAGARCKQVACGGCHCAVLLESGRLWLFGRNKEFQCAVDDDGEGENDRLKGVVPTSIHLPLPISFVACGSGHTVAIACGQLFEWGLLLPQEQCDLQGVPLRPVNNMTCASDYAQRLAEESWKAYVQADNVQRDRHMVKSPRAAQGLLEGAKTAACGWAHTLVLMTNGETYASGYGDKAQLGTGTRANSGAYVRCQLDRCVVAVAAGLNHSIAATQDGQVFTWGHGALGQLGLGREKESMLPARVALPSQVRIVGVTAGDAHSLAVADTGKLYGWGHTEYFQLGRPHNSDGHLRWVEPRELPSIEDALHAHAGGSFSICVTRSRLVSWGWNTKRQLGQGAFGYGMQPMPINFPALPAQDHLRFKSVDCGMEFAACIVEPDPAVRHLHVWGPKNLRLAAHQYVANDVSIRVGQESVGCHRRMLEVRCPKLAAEAEGGDIVLTNTSKSSVEAVLDYIYRDHGPSSACDIAEVALLARRFELPRLLAMLECGTAVQARQEGEGRYVRRAGKWILQDEEMVVPKTVAVSAQVSTFYQDMRSLQASGDLVIHLRSGTAERHETAWRSLLCEVEYFRALLESSFSEAAQSDVTVRVESIEAAVIAIQYLHTGDRRQQEYPAVEPAKVALVADLFGIEDLMDLADAWAARASA